MISKKAKTVEEDRVMRRCGSLATAVLGFCAFLSTTSANAQSNVTLYGFADAGITYVHNSGGKANQYAMTSGRLNASRWGLTANEDLGGGLKALFTLESGFNIASGAADTAGTEFSRQAFIGLSSDQWGTVTLGRQYDPMVDLMLPHQGDSFMGGLFTTPGDIDDVDGDTRLNNAVKWVGKNYNGLQAGGIYSFGGASGSMASGQGIGGVIAYNHGPFFIGAGGLHIDNGNPAVSARQTTSAQSIFFTAINGAYATASAINIGRVTTSYAVGNFIVGGYYSFADYAHDGYSTFRKSERFHVGSGYVHWQVTPSLETQLAVNFIRALGDSSAVYETAVLGAIYHFSKRTSIYLEGGYGHANGKNGAGAAQAAIGTAMIDAGKPSQVLVTAGISQAF